MAPPSDGLTVTRWAVDTPDRPGVVMAGSGQAVSYAELEDRANRIAHVLRSRGLRRGDHVAYLLDNSPSVFEVVYACQRSGLYYTPLNTRLTASEASHIVHDAAAKVVFASTACSELAEALARQPDVGTVERWLSVGGDLRGYEPLDELASGMPAGPVPDPSPGAPLLYSSGTTGRAKGIERPLPDGEAGGPDAFLTTLSTIYGLDSATVYLCPAPLYHGAGLWYSTAIHRIGGTCVVMEKFSAEGLLAAVERYRVTHAQVVPTMLIRLLKLPPPTRDRFDLRSLRVLIHAAAPCPVPVKEQVIEWLGPIVWEYFAATEANGYTVIGTDEWLVHKGSVGRAIIGTPHIVGDDGCELPAHEPGTVYFDGVPAFEYRHDDAKTAGSRHPKGWTTTGDIGYLDDDGYLYLTDRKAFTIISGGVNVYPQEVENVLAVHPDVLDVAVIGVPDDDLGEAVRAVVQLADPSAATPEMADALIDWCRARLAHHKCPRAVDFTDELPRQENGKLYKSALRSRYWQGHRTAII